LPLVESQLEVGSAAPREVLRTPLNVEDAVGRCATYRSEYAGGTINQIQVIPVWHDGVVVSGPRQTLVAERRVRSCKLGVAVGRQINTREALAVQGERERQGDGGHLIIPVITNVGRAQHDASAYLNNGKTRAGYRRWGRCWRKRWRWAGCR